MGPVMSKGAPNKSFEPDGLPFRCATGQAAAHVYRYVYKEHTKGAEGIINNNALDLINITILRPL